MPVSMIAASFAIAGEEPSGISARSRLQRVRGEARVTIRREGAHNRLDVLRQSGSAKVRLPRIAATRVTVTIRWPDGRSEERALESGTTSATLEWKD